MGWTRAHARHTTAPRHARKHRGLLRALAIASNVECNAFMCPMLTSARREQCAVKAAQAAMHVHSLLLLSAVCCLFPDKMQGLSRVAQSLALGMNSTAGANTDWNAQTFRMRNLRISRGMHLS